MKTSILKDFSTAAALMTASIFTPLALHAQWAPEDPISLTDAVKVDAAKDEGIAKVRLQENVEERLVAAIEGHPNVRLTDFFQKLRYAQLRSDYDEVFGFPNGIEISARDPKFIKTFAGKTFGDFASDSDFTDKVSAAVDAELRKRMIGPIKRGDTIFDVAERDPSVRQIIINDTYNILPLGADIDNAAGREFAKRTRMNEVFAADGNERPALGKPGGLDPAVARRAVDIVGARPLADLVEPENNRIISKLVADAHEQVKSQAITPAQFVEIADFVQRRDARRWAYIQYKSDQFKISDVLDKSRSDKVAVSYLGVISLEHRISASIRSYVADETLRYAKTDISLLEFLRARPDPTGVIGPGLDQTPLFKAIRDDKILLPETALALKVLPLRSVVQPDGGLSLPKIRDAIIESIGDKSVIDVDYPLLTILSPELAAVKKSLTYMDLDEMQAAPGQRRIEVLNATHMKDFATNGDDHEFVARIAKFGREYPAEERAFDTVRYKGEDGQRNPWHDRRYVGTKVPDTETEPNDDKHSSRGQVGVSADVRSFSIVDGGRRSQETVIPYTFKLPPLSEARTDVKGPEELTAEEKDVVRFTLWRMTQGVGVRFKEYSNYLPQTPDRDGDMSPRGLWIDKADLRSMPLNGNPEEVGTTAGVTLLPANPEKGYQHVNVVFHQSPQGSEPPSNGSDAKSSTEPLSYAKDLPIVRHEINHALGFSHPFDPMGEPLPGTVNRTGDHNLNMVDPKSASGVVGIGDDVVTESYLQKTRFVNVTPTLTDDQIAVWEYGKGPVDTPANGPAYVRLKFDNDGAMIKGRDPMVAWVNSDKNYVQVIPAPDGKPVVLDLRSVDNTAVNVTNPLDLTKVTNDLLLENSGKYLALTRISIPGAHNYDVRLNYGDVTVGSGDNMLSVEQGGWLVAGGGSDHLIGGTTLPTNFSSGTGPTTFVIRANPDPIVVRDLIAYYKQGDLVVAPKDTVRVEYSRATLSNNDNRYTLNPMGWTVEFLDRNNKELKLVTLATRPGERLDIRDVRIESVEGKHLRPKAHALPEAEPTFVPQNPDLSDGPQINMLNRLVAPNPQPN